MATKMVRFIASPSDYFMLSRVFSDLTPKKNVLSAPPKTIRKHYCESALWCSNTVVEVWLGLGQGTMHGLE